MVGKITREKLKTAKITKMERKTSKAGKVQNCKILQKMHNSTPPAGGKEGRGSEEFEQGEDKPPWVRTAAYIWPQNKKKRQREGERFAMRKRGQCGEQEDQR